MKGNSQKFVKARDRLAEQKRRQEEEAAAAAAEAAKEGTVKTAERAAVTALITLGEDAVTTKALAEYVGQKHLKRLRSRKRKPFTKSGSRK